LIVHLREKFLEESTIIQPEELVEELSPTLEMLQEVSVSRNVVVDFNSDFMR
jgi:hypothetical protein